MKKILFTDIHFGNKHNAKQYNEDCDKFIDFVCDTVNQYKKQNEEVEIIFCGDWHDNRYSVELTTLAYMVNCTNKLNELNVPVKMIIGNHDMYYKDRRDSHCLSYINDYKNIQIIDNPVYKGNSLYVPFLVSDESLSSMIREYNPKYVFGHFEIPSFKLNRYSVFNGVYSANEYTGPEKIFSGHFHTRQEKDNIIYIGACFGMDFSDESDEMNKGITILDDITGEVEYRVWDDAPVYKQFTLSYIKANELQLHDYKKLYLKIIIDNVNDIDVNSDIAMTAYRTKLKEKYPNIRTITFKNQESEKEEIEDTDVNIDISKFQNVESMIIYYINELETDAVNKDKLIKLFQEV